MTHQHSWEPVDLREQVRIRGDLGIEGNASVQYCPCPALLVGGEYALAMQRPVTLPCHICNGGMIHRGPLAFAHRPQLQESMERLGLADAQRLLLDFWECSSGHFAIDQYRVGVETRDRPPIVEPQHSTALYFLAPIHE